MHDGVNEAKTLTVLRSLPINVSLSLSPFLLYLSLTISFFLYLSLYIYISPFLPYLSLVLSFFLFLSLYLYLHFLKNCYSQKNCIDMKLRDEPKQMCSTPVPPPHTHTHHSLPNTLLLIFVLFCVIQLFPLFNRSLASPPLSFSSNN